MALPPGYSSIYNKLDCDIWRLWGVWVKGLHQSERIALKGNGFSWNKSKSSDMMFRDWPSELSSPLLPNRQTKIEVSLNTLTLLKWCGTEKWVIQKSTKSNASQARSKIETYSGCRWLNSMTSCHLVSLICCVTNVCWPLDWFAVSFWNWKK